MFGFFKENIEIDTNEVPGSPDQVDLIVNVVEKPTGNLSIGAGYSQADKLSFLASIKQENVFGSGNYLGLDVNTSDYNRQLVLSTTNPYFTADGVSRTFDLYHKTSSPYSEQGGDYELQTTGGGIRLGVPFTEQDTVFFGIGAEQTRIEPGNGLPQIAPFASQDSALLRILTQAHFRSNGPFPTNLRSHCSS